MLGYNDQAVSTAEEVCVSIATRFPTAVDTIVVGAGTAGSVVAGRLAAGICGRTLLLEAGPDYGPADSGRWPRDLLTPGSAVPVPASCPDVRGIELASRWFDQNRASFSTPEEMIAETVGLSDRGAFGSGNTVAIDLIETAGTAARLPENFANGPDDTCWSASSLRSLVQRRRPREGPDGRGGALGICAGKSDARHSAITDRLLARREGRCLL